MPWRRERMRSTLANGERGNAWITALNWVENVDSLAAVKKLIYDEKKSTMAQLVEVLRANWGWTMRSSTWSMMGL